MMKKSIITAMASVIAWITFIIISAPVVGFMYYDGTDYANLLFNIIAKEATYSILISLIDATAVWSLIELVKSKTGSVHSIIVFSLLSVIMLLTFFVFPYVQRFDIEAFDIAASALLIKMIIGTILSVTKFRKAKKADQKISSNIAL